MREKGGGYDYSGPDFGLHEDVQRPLEYLISRRIIRADEIDDHCLDRLKRLDEDVAIEVINKFCEANFKRVKNKVGSSHSPSMVLYTYMYGVRILSIFDRRHGVVSGCDQSGFLSGIIRRFEDDPRGSRAGMANLPRDLRGRFDSVVERGLMTDNDLEARVCDQLANLSRDLADEAIDKFLAADLSTIRSKTGFLMGIIRRITDNGRDYRR